MIGTLNVRELGMQNALGRLMALAHLMELRNVSVLAVQEAELVDTRDLPAQVNLNFHGAHAARTVKRRRAGGTGFLVTSCASKFLTYLGKRASATHVSTNNLYAAEWGHLYGEAPE